MMTLTGSHQKGDAQKSDICQIFINTWHRNEYGFYNTALVIHEFKEFLT